MKSSTGSKATLRKEISFNKRLMEAGSYRGFRHCRGSRYAVNAHTYERSHAKGPRRGVAIASAEESRKLSTRDGDILMLVNFSYVVDFRNRRRDGSQPKKGTKKKEKRMSERRCRTFVAAPPITVGMTLTWKATSFAGPGCRLLGFRVP